MERVDVESRAAGVLSLWIDIGWDSAELEPVWYGECRVNIGDVHELSRIIVLKIRPAVAPADGGQTGGAYCKQRREDDNDGTHDSCET